MGTPSADGLFASLKRLAASGIELAQLRLELLASEVELQKTRLFDALLWALAAWVLGTIGLLLMVLLILFLLQDGYRVAATAVFALLFLAGAAGCGMSARRRLRTPGGEFPASRAELQRDADALSPRPADAPPPAAAPPT